jgi:membrane-associated protease RseP (regulator of RpoE activity)
VTYAIYAVLISQLILVSVAVHEFGHLLTAKAFGMKATEYFVGFGPRIFSFHRGETEYGLKAIPAGGYVKIIGMSPLENDGTRSSADISRAAAAMTDLPTDMQPDERRLFYTYPAWQRVIVLVTGSLTHFVLAVALVFAALWVGGDFTANPVPHPVFDSVAPCADPAADGSCPAGSTPTAAARAGLRAGDRIAAIGSTTITSYDQLATIVRRSPGRTLVFHVVRDGRLLPPIDVTPTARTATLGDSVTIPFVEVGFLGIAPQLTTPQLSAGGAIGRTFPVIGTTLSSAGTVLGNIPHEVGQILTGQQRGGNDAITVIGAVRETGAVGASAEFTTREKVGNLLFIGGQVNLDVGILNLLPLLPLDGGHVAIVWFEQLRKRLAFRRGRPDPGRVNILKVLPVAYSIFALIVVLAGILVYADIAHPISVT